jgi:CubicO group peptidase (beta-lactamase class C family)
MDLVDVLLAAVRPFSRTCHIPRSLDAISRVGDEVRPREVGATSKAVDEVVTAFEATYRTGLYPAMQLCIRRDGGRVLHRAIGHARGNEPGAGPGAEKVQVELDTPFCIYSASKAITAMAIHKLDEDRVLHIDDRVCDYIPEFGVDGKQFITIRHVLGHRAGIPQMPAEAMDLDLLTDRAAIVKIMCQAPRLSRPGRRLAYHAISGGFVLGEVVQRAAGEDLRSYMHREICKPLGFQWMNYGVRAKDVKKVGRDAVTGLPLGGMLSRLSESVLGTTFEKAVEMACDPRFLRGIVPSANVCSNADELCAFYQCLLQEGELNGVRVFEPRTLHRATAEQAYWELDLTLGLPLRHGLGFMLGSKGISPYGLQAPRAFGHIGLTNIFSWADPDRRLAVALVTSGKPVLTPEIVRLASLIHSIGTAFPPIETRRRAAASRRSRGPRSSATPKQRVA